MKEPLLTKCIKKATSPTAGILLYRIMFWTLKGYPEIYKSIPEWSEETGLSAQQAKDALILLEKKLLIKREQRGYNGRSKSCVRLTPRGLQTQHDGSTDPALSGPQTQHIYSENFYSENYSEEQSPPLTSSGNFPSDVSSVSGEQDQDKEVEMIPKKTVKQPALSKGKSVADILAEANNKPTEYTGKQNSLGHMVHVWKTGMYEHHGMYVGSVSKKEQAQLKMFLDACPPGAFPAPLLAVVIKHWAEFCVEAGKSGAFKTPLKPNFDFLIKYRVVAVNFALAKIAHGMAKKSQEQPKPLDKPAPVEQNPVQLIAEESTDEADNKATLADLMDEDDD